MPSHIRRRTITPWLIGSVAFAAQLAVAAPPVEFITDSADSRQSAESEYVGFGTGGCCETCQGCCRGRDLCCPTVEEVKEEQSCWKVRSEKVCVPAIRLPWEPGGSGITLFSWLKPRGTPGHCGDGVPCSEEVRDCGLPCADIHCQPKCGPVRCVCVLEEETFEVTKCQCKWEIRRQPCCCHGPCACGGYDSAPFESDASGVLPAPQP